MPQSSYTLLGPSTGNRGFVRRFLRRIVIISNCVCRSSYPTSKLAAVLILLYEKSGQIRVLLTTRAKSLRSHPGQTALPGGKYDSSDADLIATAVSLSYLPTSENLFYLASVP